MYSYDEIIFILDLLRRRLNELEVNHYKGTDSYIKAKDIYDKTHGYYSDIHLALKLEKELENVG